MGKISFKDIVELAKAGYKPADVKELISLSEMADQSKQEEPQGAAGAIDKPEPESPEPDRAPENKEPEKPKEAVDYKKLYEQRDDDLKKAQEDLKRAQAANIKKDAAPAQAPDPMANLTDLVSSFL